MLHKINHSALLVSYKLLHDTLFLLLISFALLITLNGMLPEFFLQGAFFVKIILLLMGNIAAIAFLGKKLDINYAPSKIRKNLFIPFLLIFGFLAIGNALLKLKFLDNLLLTSLLLISTYQFYLLETDEQQ